MRVAFDSQIFAMQEYGGISRYVCSLAKALALQPDVESKIFAPLHINAYLKDVPSEFVHGYKVPRVPKIGHLLRSTSQFLAQSAINSFHPDVIHETYYAESSVNIKNIRNVVTVYDMIHERFPSGFSVKDRTSEWKQVATQRVDHVICISESTRKDLLEFFDLPENKVSVVYLGFDSLMPVISTGDTKSKPYLLYVGHRGGYKNFEGFLRAYASSLWLSDNFNVVCFGGGIFSRDEVALIKSLRLSMNHVIQVNGGDNKLASVYRDAALFVYPSLYEGFGIPPLEAMSLGCPVACSNTSSIPEVAGDAAEYFDPYDLDSMRTAMELVLSSEVRLNELIKLGKFRCARFSWDRCAKETLSVYKGLK